MTVSSSVPIAPAFAAGAGAHGATANKSGAARVAAASLVGTTLEFYDHFIFGTAAALIFPKIFFPQSDPFMATILSLLSYGIEFVARPVVAVRF